MSEAQAEAAAAPRFGDLDSERDELIYRLRVVDRLTFSEIGKRVGLSAQRAGEMYTRVAATIPPPDLAAVRAESYRLMRHVQQEALALAEREGAPVFVGKDGVVAREPGKPGESDGEIVRDYALRNVALKLAMEADKEIRKLMGADAASKVESTSTVKYSIEGVDLDGLK